MRIVITTLITAAAIAATTLPSVAQTVLRFADYGPNRGIRAEYAIQFLEEIETRSEGRIKIEQHWAQALLPATDIFNGVKNGVASLGTVTASYSLEELFGYRVGDLPVTNPHEVAGNMALYELATTHPVLKEEFEREGVVYLLNYAVGPIQLICKGDPIRSVDDFRGKRIRATADYGAIYGSLGAVHAAIPLPEAYQGLDSGLIDCSQAYGYVVESYRLYEVADSFTKIDGGTIQSNAIFMNRREFDALEPQDQEMLVALGKEYTEIIGKAMRQRNQEVTTSLEEGIDGNKLEVVQLGDEDRAKLEEAGEPFIEAYVEEGEKRGVDAAALVDDFTALITKYREIYAD